jgi:hypothetical protein
MTTKTSLQYIDSAFQEVLEKQASAGDAPLSVKTKVNAKHKKNIAGFEVIDDNRVQRSIAEYIEQIKAYAVKRATLIDRLTKQGIPVLATLPNDLWHKVCDESGLHRFSPDGGGKVYVNIDTENKSNYVFASNVMAIIVSYIAAYAATTGFFAWVSGATFHWPQYAIFAGISLITFTPIIFLFGDSLTDMFLRMFIPSEKSLLKSLIFEDGVFSQKTELVLPKPPANVASVLLRASDKGYRLHVAAVSEAVSFNPPLRHMLFARIKETQALKKERARLERELRNDPIVYIEYDGITAIIAQFGDFPIEKTIVDRLVAEEVVEQPY